VPKLTTIGVDWVIDEVENFIDHVDHVKPSDFNEQHRYLPESVSSIPGFIRYDVNPFMREIIDCFDINSPVREINVMKGVQITYTTLLESVMLYYMGHIKTVPMMYMTADKELATARIENNILPMLQQSDFGHIIRSSDEGNTRKTGKTVNHLQWEGGGYLIPFGARNADKMRSFSIMVLLKDEIDAWLETVGKDGDPDSISDDRCKGYWERRKIGRGSTPLIKGSSKIEAAYKRGDQRKYFILCVACGYPQAMRWNTVDKNTGVIGGFVWETENGVLQLESVCYCCQNCGHAHYEHDKERLFSPDYGAHWKPTAQPAEPNIRSYHLPAFYSPIGMAPWYSLVSDYLKGYDPVERKVIDIGVYQKFYNNVLARPFEPYGAKVQFSAVSAHRRAEYRLGQIPNKHAIKYSGSSILFLICTVDVHKDFIQVCVTGIARDLRTYIIDYLRFERSEKEDECGELTSPVWGRLREIIEEKEYIADDGRKYKILLTLVDAGYANATVCSFASDYMEGVYPILGRQRSSKNQTIKEFGKFETQSGTVGYRVNVDHYKDRLALVLRREWVEQSGDQKPYHWNAPVDISDRALKELTVETRIKKTDENGNVFYCWHRPGNARNELWDCSVYTHAAVEILAWNICIEYFELETINWNEFWTYMEKMLIKN